MPTQNRQLSQVGSYLVTVSDLTPKTTGEMTQGTGVADTVPSLASSSPLIVYAPIAIFFLIFIIALSIQITHRILDAKKFVTAVVIALFFASAPMTLTYIQEGIKTRSNASPDQVPKNIRVLPVSKSAIRIYWDTDATISGGVRIDSAPLSDKSTVVIGDGGFKTKNHSVLYTQFQSGLTYNMEILSGTVWYTDSGNPIHFLIPR
jgi:hypothetical protein